MSIKDSTAPNETENTGKRASIGARRNPASQEAILEAAEIILKEEGLQGFSIEAVARRARAGKPTIYRWWPSRTALLLDVYLRYKSSRPTPDTGSLREDLRAFLSHQLIGFWQDQLCGTIFRSIIAEAQSDPHAAEALKTYDTERRQHTVIIVERAKERGEIPQDAHGDLVIELIVSFAWHRLLTGGIAQTPQDIDAVIELLLSGIHGADITVLPTSK